MDASGQAKFCFEVKGSSRDLALIAESGAEAELWKAYIAQTVECVKEMAARQVCVCPPGDSKSGYTSACRTPGLAS